MQEAATVRKSETQITNDYELLSLKWTCLEDLQTGMATGPKQQVTPRIPRNFLAMLKKVSS